MSSVKPRAEGPPSAPLARRLLAEALGTGLLVCVVIGSGIAAERLSPGQAGLQLLENSTATVLGLAVLIVVLGPVSGAHFNPVVSAVDWALSRWARAAGGGRAGLAGRDVVAYAAAQVGGAVLGAVLANGMHALDAVQVSGRARASWPAGLAEVVATAGLVLVIFALARTAGGALTAVAVGAYIGSAYWFTSSTSFANPAVTVGRIFSDTFAGITPGSVPAFVLAQVAGGALGLVLVLALYPDLTTAGGARVAAARAVAADVDRPAAAPAKEMP
jgi:glycerol uptake facilitator-like aquaporin